MLALFITATVVAFLIAMKVMGRAVERDRANNLANAPAVLDGTFDGSAAATYTVALGSLPVDAVVRGAAERGYRLTGQIPGAMSSTKLTFERV